jgi:hypothetical protein
MCQRLYIASRTQLSPVRKRKSAPHLGLHPLDDADCSIRRLFPAAEFPHVYVAEAFAPCGCGFPEAIVGQKRRKVEPEAACTMRRLAVTLQPAVKGRPRVKLLLSCLGDEDEPVVQGRTISLVDLEDPQFRFQSREILTVVKTTP